MSKKIIFLLLLFCGQAAALFGWGVYGHEVCARIAWEHLSPETKNQVKALLGGDRDAFVTASYWADRVRHARPESKPWHYVNVPPERSYEAMRDCPRGGCLPWAIEHFTHVLTDPTVALPQKQEALKYTLHFIGDLHQPLHVGYLSDRGGNFVKVQFRGKQTNLHAVWDSLILDFDAMPQEQYIQLLLKRIGPEQINEWQSGTIEDWLNESRALLGPHVYAGIGSEDLRGKYSTEALPIVDEQLLKAGVRAAGLLNSIFEVPH